MGSAGRRIKYFGIDSPGKGQLQNFVPAGQPAELKIVIPCICEDVVNEVFRNVQKKLPGSVAHFYALFKKLPFKIIDPFDEDIALARKFINEKDAVDRKIDLTPYRHLKLTPS